MTHSPEDVRDGLARCFLRNGADRPQWLADLAEPIVRTALEDRDRELRGRAEEITRLEALVESLAAACAAGKRP